MPYPLKPIPTSRLITLYQAGASLASIAATAEQEFGVSISWVAVRKRLINKGIYVIDREKVIPPDVVAGKKPQGYLRKPPRFCGFEGCGGRAYSDDPYCRTHQRRVERHGDPAAVRRRGRKPR